MSSYSGGILFSHVFSCKYWTSQLLSNFSRKRMRMMFGGIFDVWSTPKISTISLSQTSVFNLNISLKLIIILTLSVSLFQLICCSGGVFLSGSDFLKSPSITVICRYHIRKLSHLLLIILARFICQCNTCRTFKSRC